MFNSEVFKQEPVMQKYESKTLILTEENVTKVEKKWPKSALSSDRMAVLILDHSAYIALACYIFH